MQKKERKVFRKMRQGLRISTARLARETGIYRTRLSEWENGRVDLTPEEELKIGDAMDAVLTKRGLPGVITPEEAANDARKGSVLARLRDQFRITQTALAEKAEMNQSKISSFEKGDVELSAAQEEKLFTAFNDLVAEQAAKMGKVTSLASLRPKSEQKAHLLSVLGNSQLRLAGAWNGVIGEMLSGKLTRADVREILAGADKSVPLEHRLRSQRLALKLIADHLAIVNEEIDAAGAQLAGREEKETSVHG
ncbi:MAG: hypothetical protein DMG96_25100 [Acidobacteria bacterium]|nr:MAG: hypothetical protein DMG96_25100 [Acidobacteriota bacterium]